MNTDANKTMWPSSSSSASSGRLKRSDSKNGGGEEDANTQSLSGRSSPFSSSQDLGSDYREERHAESEGHHGEHHEEFAKAARRMGRV